MSTQVNMKKGVVGPMHSHPHEQVNYILSGSLEVTINGEKTILIAGDSYYVEPDVVHGAVALLDTVMFETFTPQREDML
jgi:quercetin dioxygenase-like cupin family protein